MIAELDPDRLKLDLADPGHRDAWVRLVRQDAEIRVERALAAQKKADTQARVDLALERERMVVKLTALGAKLEGQVAELRRQEDESGRLLMRLELYAAVAETAADQALDFTSAARGIKWSREDFDGWS